MRIGIDIGGTFTDFVLLDSGLTSFKVLSTPGEPDRAVLEGLARIAGSDRADISHGTTAGTNAVLERRGAHTAFVATAGFRDLLLIGRQNRSSIYDLYSDRPEPLIPPERSFEIEERVDRNGQALRILTEAEIERMVTEIRASGAESVAVCLLFSFLEPAHEVRLARALRDAGIPVSISSEVRPEFREYERASATALDAYLAPGISSYLTRLETALPNAHLRIMQSNGGAVTPDLARQRPIRSLLSGPAAGVIGAQFIARLAEESDLLTFDMGGTSTDVCLIRGEPRLTSEASIDGLPIGIPVMDVHTVGAGGGSIASVDAGGALRVGPRSAGADPGPACYGRGGLAPTVTDANVVLGRLPPETFQAGGVRLNPAAAEAALGKLATELGLRPALDLSAAQSAALGLLDVVQAHMARALRVISLERGYDPADFVLVAFGGAAGLHACDLAREVGARRVLVPAAASALSALGMLAAEAVFPTVQSVLLPETEPFDSLEHAFEPLMAAALRDLDRDGIPVPRRSLQRSLDVRYQGQSFEINVPLTADFRSSFDRLHEENFGYSDADWPVEIVNLRLLAVGTRDPWRIPSAPPRSTPEKARARRRIRTVLKGGTVELPLHTSPLPHGFEIQGPAIVALPDSTVLLTRADLGRVDEWANLRIEVGRA